MARDTSTLRDILFDELEALRDGTSEPKRAAAVAKLSAQIIGTAKVELDYHKLALQAKASGEELVLGSMDLGGRAALAVQTAHSRQVERRELQTQENSERVDQSARHENTSTG